LYKGEIFALINENMDGPGGLSVVALSMQSGSPNWNASFDYRAGGESSTISVYDGVMFFGAGDTGVTKVIAGNASDGSFLWEYDSGEVMWNFSPSSPGDGTLIFASSCGCVTRLSSTGEEMWKSGDSHPGAMCGPGGGALGPNGVFYSEFNSFEDKQQQWADSSVEEAAYVRAIRIEDGSILWEKQYELGGNQYPAVGQLGEDGPLAVVIAVGDGLMNANLPLRNKVYALDAETGDVLWVIAEDPWWDPMGAGERNPHGEGEGTVCYPDPQGIPVISGDGTVYASSSHGGELRAIKDMNGDGQIDDSEISIFETNNCFLNSPSIAPGMLVAAPCWGPMYVFKA
jgi:outer membrane protein assembly factor BamB